ncbi:MAG: flagellar assembly protein A [Campylobacterota bacterium]|nr:flagellar assembly protein A [Campylobacterota bacterium]
MSDAVNNNSNTAKSIQPVVVRTENVAKELVRIASSYKVPVGTLDFTLFSFQTFTKGAGDSEDWMELSSDEVKDLDDNLSFLDEDFQIKQSYEIEIFTLVDTPALDTLDVSIGANSLMTKVYLTIKPGSTLEYYDDFSKDFLALINKKKLRANLMINIFDKNMTEVVRSLKAKLQINEHLRFEKKEILLVGEGIDPVATVSDALILHYESEQDEVEESDRIDYSKRGYLLSAVENELLIEYIKPKLGEAGRNCRGEYIKPEEPIIANEPTFSVSEKIEVTESDTNILYRSKDNGYVTFENATYDIKSEVDVSEISFKTTGSIETDLNADVSINVKEKDVMKDAIGMGMEVEVNEIHVEGNVGPNAKIRSMKAVVEGQTHKSSYVESDVLDINIHKGKAKGRELHITRLEHGEVEADVVTISQALGGKVTAREITIETLGSHVTLSASHLISISKLQGGENTLIIDPMVSEDCQHSVEDNTKLIQEARVVVKNLKAEVAQHLETIRKNEPAYMDIKKRLIHYKKNGVKMPAAFVKKYKQFHAFYERSDALKVELKEKEENFELLQARFTSAQNSIFDARIINNDRWRNHNEIIFKLVDPAMEINFIPEHNTVMKALGLKEKEEEFYIAEVDE